MRRFCFDVARRLRSGKQLPSRTSSHVAQLATARIAVFGIMGRVMSEGIIERAARALAQSASGHDDWDLLTSKQQEAIMDDARAVLQAIREPSAEMSVAGATVMRNINPEAWHQHGRDAASAWRFMIAAALNE